MKLLLAIALLFSANAEAMFLNTSEPYKALEAHFNAAPRAANTNDVPWAKDVNENWQCVIFNKSNRPLLYAPIAKFNYMVKTKDAVPPTPGKPGTPDNGPLLPGTPATPGTPGSPAEYGPSGRIIITSTQQYLVGAHKYLSNEYKEDPYVRYYSSAKDNAYMIESFRNDGKVIAQAKIRADDNYVYISYEEYEKSLKLYGYCYKK